MRIFLLVGCVTYSLQCDVNQNSPLYLKTRYYDETELSIITAKDNSLEDRLLFLENLIENYEIGQESTNNLSNKLYFDQLPFDNFELLEKHKCTSVATKTLHIVKFFIGHHNSTIDQWKDGPQYVRITCSLTTREAVCTAAFNSPKSLMLNYVMLLCVIILAGMIPCILCVGKYEKFLTIKITRRRQVNLPTPAKPDNSLKKTG